MKLMRNRKGNLTASSFWKDESGMGTVEIILIIVVLIALVIIFKSQLTSLVNTIFVTITDSANTVLE